MSRSRLLLFGDQSVEKLEPIRKLVHSSKHSQTLRRFLREAADVVQAEVAKLGPAEKAAFYGFDDLLALAEQNASEDTPNEICATALICIIRIGELLLYAENDPGILTATGSTLHVLGFCTGLLPAAAALMSANLTDLIKYGLEIVAMSVRMGREIHIRSQYVDRSSGSWAYTFIGTTTAGIQSALKSFHKAQAIPIHKQVYIAVISRTWTTCFGPPSTFDQFFQACPELALAPKLELPVGGAVHAAHLPQLDVERIIGDSPLLNTPLRSNTQCISSSTCKPYEASNLRGLLRLMLDDILQKVLHLTDMMGQVVLELQGSREVDICVAGPTGFTPIVQEALRSAKVSVNIMPSASLMPPTQSKREGSDLVAIVGISGRFPGGDTLQEFWNMLAQGQDVHQEIPSSRFDLQTHFDASGAERNTMSTKYGCFVKNMGVFDTKLFNISPREALQMDPMQRLLLLATYEAMEMAGYSPDGALSTNRKRIATYIGQATDDWRQNDECQGIDAYYIPGVARAFYPGRLNYHFKWEGGAYSLDAACASSSTAVHLACSALLSRECDTAVAGGANALSAPAIFTALSRGGFLSKTGNCKPFRDDADGYCRGEGAGVVILKRLEDAVAENDNVLAVINGSGRNYSADAASITQPFAPNQKKLYQDVLRKSGVDPHDIGYVEMHGTGTQAGDPVEIQSVGEVFCQNREKNNPLYIGAVKANVGHGEAAAGITSLIKSVLMLRQGRIPPHPGYPFKVNEKFASLEKRNMRISGADIPFKHVSPKDGKRRIFLNNFDAAGGNTCLVVEEFLSQNHRGRDPRQVQVVTCSGRTVNSLRENQRRLLNYITSNPDTKLCDLAYSTTARKMHEPFRAAYTVQSPKQLTEKLNLDCTQDYKVTNADPQGSVVFVFTGQGSMYPGMGKQLFSTCSRFRESILLYEKTCNSLSLPPVAHLISGLNTGHEDEPTIFQSQLAIVFIELALADLWRSWGLVPSLLLGHSLGEYSALCVSGVLSVSDTLYLVGSRSSILHQRCTPSTYAMLATSATPEEIERACKTSSLSSCEISCMNAPNQTVASGKIKHLKDLEHQLSGDGKKTTFLPILYGFHSAQVEPILDEFGRTARSVKFAKPNIPIASTLTGTIVDETGTFSSKYLVRQAREPVNFVGALNALKSSGKASENSTWIEIGPEASCLGMVRASISVPSTRLLPSLKSTEENWRTLSASLSTAYLAKLPVNWSSFHQEYTDALTFLELPSYAFDLKEYWIPYKQEALGTGSVLASRNNVEPSHVSKPVLTTCLQHVIEESFSGDAGSVTFASYTSDPQLYSAIQGHKVNDVALCPASVFCDMALTAAKYVHSKTNSIKSEPFMSIHGLEMVHPITVPEVGSPQTIEVKASKAKGESLVKILYSSKGSQNTSSTHNGSCEVQFGAKDGWKKEFSRTMHLVRKRADTIQHAALAGAGHRLPKPIVYKLFSSLVKYSAPYQGIEEAFVESGYRESTARIRLEPGVAGGQFTCNPYWIDNLVHLAGFMLNGDATKSDDTTYIASSLDVLHLVEELSESEQYTCYVCVQDSVEKKDHMFGDAYIFSGERLVAICAGMCFQRMPRKVLAAVLCHSPVATAAPVTTQPKPTTQHHTNKAAESKSSLQGTNTMISVEAPIDRKEAVTSKSSDDTAEKLLNIVASESGFALEDMENSTPFADMGVDSIMSITIISAAKSQLGLELPASFFISHPTVQELRNELGASTNDEEDDAADSSSSFEDLGPTDTEPTPEEASPVDGDDDLFSPATSREDTGFGLEPTHKAKPILEPQPEPQAIRSHRPKSNAVLLQGRTSCKENPVFLATDGAGSATAYIHFPPLPGGRRMYALESPYLSNPLDYKCSVQECCAFYIDAIRENQPHGPYLLGGWSAGAIYAYEIARQLTEMGETIQCLFLMDMRVPRPMPDAIEPNMVLIEQAGLVTGIRRTGQIMTEASTRLKQHLVSTVRGLIRYQPVPFDPAKRPKKSFMVWAERGISEEKSARMTDIDVDKINADTAEKNVMEDESTGLRGWFFAKRKAFGPNGWDEMVGDIECHTVAADHFAMVQPPAVKTLGKILRASVEKSEADSQ